MNDPIERQRVSDLFDAWEAAELDHHIPKILRDRLKIIPSIQPEPQWIPVSERLPGDSKFVLMTIRRMNEHYNHEPFISVGYISWNQSAWWCAHEGDCKSNDVRVDAWMPLPEPYSERRTDGN